MSPQLNVKRLLGITACLLFPIFILACFFFTPIVSGDSARLKQELDRHFLQYQTLKLDAKAVVAEVQATGHLSLVSPDTRFDVELIPNDMRADVYRAEDVGTDGLIRPLDTGPVRTFKGLARWTENGLQEGQARFTLDENGIEGLIIAPYQRYFVEPARNYSKDATKKDYVIYRESDIITSSSGACGTTLSEKVKERADAIQGKNPLAISTSIEMNVNPSELLPTAANTNLKGLRSGSGFKPSFVGCATMPLSSGQTVNGNLQGNCASEGRWFDIYTFSGVTGQSIIVVMSSSVFNCYLYLLAPDGSFIAEDDDGFFGSNARIPHGSAS